MTAIRAAILDMDGLLIDSEPLYRRASEQAAAGLGYEFDGALAACIVGRSGRDVERILYERLGTQFPMDEFRRLWQAQWQDIVAAEGICPKPGAARLLAALDGAGCPVAIATSTGRDRARQCLAAADLDAAGRVLVCGEEVAKGKPAPDVYLEAARRLAVAPAWCIALEDSPAGVAAAAAAGMRVIMVPDLEAPGQAQRGQAWRVLASLEEALPVILDGLDAGA